MISAISLTLVVAGCASAPVATIAPVARDIGPPPADLQEVKVAEPRAGESAFVIADRERFGRKLANYRLCRLRGEWVQVRIDMLAGTGDVAPPKRCTPPSAEPQRGTRWLWRARKKST